MSAPQSPSRRLRDHLRRAQEAVAGVEPFLPAIEVWAAVLARELPAGRRLLVAGNGGSAALAEHLTAELVGRFDAERPPFSAMPLHGDGSALTALVNDYGSDAMFSRQVEAHGRRGDTFLAISTSGRSLNLVCATEAARRLGVRAWGLTGPGPNPLADGCDAAIALEAGTTAAVQEAQQVVVHLLCTAFDDLVMGDGRPATEVLTGSGAHR